jgi:hypothetical protein
LIVESVQGDPEKSPAQFVKTDDTVGLLFCTKDELTVEKILAATAESKTKNDTCCILGFELKDEIDP